MTTVPEYQAKVEKDVVNMDRYDAFINGPNPGSVTTDSGSFKNLPTLAAEATIATVQFGALSVTGQDPTTAGSFSFAPANANWILAQAMTLTGRVRKVRVSVDSPTAAILSLQTKAVGSPTFTTYGTPKTVALDAGENVISTFNPDVEQGVHRIAVYIPEADTLRYEANISSPNAIYYAGGPPSGTVTATLVPDGVMPCLSVEIETGFRAETSAAITSLTEGLESVSSVLLPAASDLKLRFRARLAGLIGSGSPLVVVGDSLSQGQFTPSTLAKHWFNQVEDIANAGYTPTSEPGCTILRFSADPPADPAWFGLTFGGTVASGVTGPLGRSLVLAVGAWIEFPDNGYTAAEVFYQQKASGSGTLTRTHGGAGSVALSTTGTATSDKLTTFGSTATGTGAFRFTATGNPVEITGLLRLGAQVSDVNGLRVMRNAFGGYAASPIGSGGDTSQTFTNERIDSVIRQALALGPHPEYVVALMTNDWLFAQSPRPTTFVTNLTRIVTRLQASGQASRVNILSPSRPAPGSFAFDYDTDGSFELFVGLCEQVAIATSAHHLALSDADFSANGFFASDGLHWSDAGQDYVRERFIRWRAGT